MFGRHQRERIANLKDQVASLQQAMGDVIGRFNDAAKLVSIERDGRILRFVFVRNDETFTIETVAMMSDNTADWRERAGL